MGCLRRTSETGAPTYCFHGLEMLVLTEKYCQDDEIDLIDLLQVLWKRKILIASISIGCLLIAGLSAFLMPPVYRVKVVLENQGKGSLATMPAKIQGGSLDQEVMKRLGLASEDLPKLKVTSPKGTALLEIVAESSQPETAVRVLESLVDQAISRFDETLEVEREGVRGKIREHGIIINTLDKKIKLIQEQAGEVAATIEGLKKTGQVTDLKASLMVNNEIRAYAIYLNSLHVQLTDLEGERETRLIDGENFHGQLDQISGLTVVNEPSVPTQPIKPRKSLMAVLGLMLGGMVSVMLAFLFEYVDRVRAAKSEGDLAEPEAVS